MVQKFERTKDHQEEVFSQMAAAAAADNEYKMKGLGNRPLLLSTAVEYHFAEQRLATALEQPAHRVPDSARAGFRKQLQDVRRRFDALASKASAMSAVELEQTLAEADGGVAAELAGRVGAEVEFLMRTWDAEYEALQVMANAVSEAVAHNAAVTASATSGYNAVRNVKGPDRYMLGDLLSGGVRTGLKMTEAGEAILREELAAAAELDSDEPDSEIEEEPMPLPTPRGMMRRREGSPPFRGPAEEVFEEVVEEEMSVVQPSKGEQKAVKAVVAAARKKNQLKPGLPAWKTEKRAAAVDDAGKEKAKTPPGFGYGRREPGRGKRSPLPTEHGDGGGGGAGIMKDFEDLEQVRNGHAPPQHVPSVPDSVALSRGRAEHGAWSMEHGAWSMEHGAWSMGHCHCHAA